MFNLTQSYETFEKPGLVVNYKMAASKIFKGAMVGLDRGGFAVPMADGLLFIGVSDETIDNSTNAAGDKSINITKCGSFVFKAANGFSPKQEHLGCPVVVRSDWEVGVGGGQTPVGTIPTVDRFGLVTVKIQGVDYYISDIAMRMLAPKELYLCQGFRRGYVHDRGEGGKVLTKTEQVRMVGNSVSPPVAEALARANCADLIVRERRAA